MAKRGGRNRQQNPGCLNQRAYSSNFWQTDAYNARLFNYYRNLIYQMALSRFRWVGLPKTCDPRFLEWTLLTQGVATIAFPIKMPGKFFSTQAVLEGVPNVYDNYPKWRSFGNNFWNFTCTSKNGVLVWDNNTRMPITDGIDLYADELVHIRRTKQMNRFHQQIPFIIKGPQERKNDMTQLAKQVSGGELAVLATNGVDNIDFDALQTGVPFLGEELAVDETNVWNRIYTMLGIKNSSMKQERQTQDEIQAQENPTTLVKLSCLNERRRAADFINENFGEYLDEPIRVVWAQDNESSNFNFHNDLKQQIATVIS